MALTDKTLALQDLAHILDLDEDLKRDDHEHELGLVDLEVQSVEERQPENNKSYQHDDQEHYENGDLSLSSELELGLN